MKSKITEMGITLCFKKSARDLRIRDDYYMDIN